MHRQHLLVLSIVVLLALVSGCTGQEERALAQLRDRIQKLEEEVRSLEALLRDNQIRIAGLENDVEKNPKKPDKIDILGSELIPKGNWVDAPGTSELGGSIPNAGDAPSSQPSPKR